MTPGVFNWSAAAANTIMTRTAVMSISMATAFKSNFLKTVFYQSCDLAKSDAVTKRSHAQTSRSADLEPKN